MASSVLERLRTKMETLVLKDWEEGGKNGTGQFLYAHMFIG
jgi:hypothetical protein